MPVNKCNPEDCLDESNVILNNARYLLGLHKVLGSAHSCDVASRLPHLKCSYCRDNLFFPFARLLLAPCELEIVMLGKHLVSIKL